MTESSEEPIAKAFKLDQDVFFERLFSLIDTDGSEYIDFREFVIVLGGFKLSNAAGRVRFAFDCWIWTIAGLLVKMSSKACIQASVNMIRNRTKEGRRRARENDWPDKAPRDIYAAYKSLLQATRRKLEEGDRLSAFRQYLCAISEALHSHQPHLGDVASIFRARGGVVQGDCACRTPRLFPQLYFRVWMARSEILGASRGSNRIATCICVLSVICSSAEGHHWTKKMRAQALVEIVAARVIVRHSGSNGVGALRDEDTTRNVIYATKT